MGDEDGPVAAADRPASPVDAATVEAGEPAADVLSPTANQIMAALWIVLLGGRWIVGSWLLAAGTVPEETMARWDDGILLTCYLILLAMTLIVLALRAVRARGPAPPTDREAQITQADASPDRRPLPDGAARRATPRD